MSQSETEILADGTEVPLLPTWEAWPELFDDAGNLYGSRCPACDAASVPPLTICASCGAMTARSMIPAEGALYSWCVVHVGPSGAQVPYALGYVDLDEGPRVLCQLDTSPVPVLDRRVRLERPSGANQWALPRATPLS